uniref:Growth factor receptor-bound protein 10-like n=1 Tax=Phallusia mammillata TaxID=59560 RepID=A0A6F9DDD1_9ASCI|nr:growth factor receptor-bound protein 10-like [Phallusia mammillata]
MEPCLVVHKEDINTLGVKAEDDVDLETLMQQIDCGNDESSTTDMSSSSGGGDTHVLHASNESIASEEESHTSSKTNFFEKHFLKSLPVAILSKRKLFGSHSDLASSAPQPSSPLSIAASSHQSYSKRKNERTLSCKIQRNGTKQVFWNVWVTDLGVWKEVELPHSSTCAMLLHSILLKLQRTPDTTTWSVIEQNTDAMLERFIEDYEIMDDVTLNEEEDTLCRLCLNKTPAKYSILQNPELCLPADMLTFPANSCPAHETADSVRRLQMQHILTKTAPEMCGWLHVREVGKSRWKKVFCILRNSGLYHSSKGTNKDPHNLICLAEVHSAHVWFPIGNKKICTNSPTNFAFCLKPRSVTSGALIRWFCADTSHLRSAWIAGLRLTMNGSRFYESYISARRQIPSNLMRSSSDRTISRQDGGYLVPMDFRGATGRVIKDPREVAMVELEQQTSWRRKLINRTLACSGMDRAGYVGNSAPPREAAWFTRAIHQTQPWYYGKISREEANEEIQRNGNIDGTFLIRESQTIAGGTVVTLCHNQKPRHIPITRVEKNGQCFYTIDNGDTRFIDLIQFVDFYRLNRGSLPCQLIHECTRSYS